MAYDHMLYMAIAKRAWGVICHLEGRYSEAGERLKQALQMFRELETLW